MRLELAQSLFELARVFQIVGKKRAASEILLRAKQIFKKSGARLWLKKVGCLWETLNKYKTER